MTPIQYLTKETYQALKNEVEANQESLDKIDGMIIYLKRQLKEMGISTQGINALARAFETFTYDSDNYTFTSDRKAKVNDLWERFDTAASKFY